MDELKRQGSTDVAALAGGIVATSIAMAIDDGPYGILGFLTSVSLVLILAAYVFPHQRDKTQSIATGAATALAALPGCGFLLETIGQWLDWPIDKDGSRVSAIAIALTWCAMLALFASYDLRRNVR